jgi:hypothetical protein
MPYGIISPMDKVIDNTDSKNVCGGQYIDFSILGNVELPKGSVIVRRNENLPDGKLKIIEADEKDGISASKGILIVESSEPDMKKLTNLILEKMGYLHFDKMCAKELDMTDEEYLLLSNNEVNAKLLRDDPDKYFELSKKMMDRYELLNEVKNNWEKFAKNSDFLSYEQMNLPWHRADALINAILVLAMTGNSWDASVEIDNQNSDDIFDDDDFQDGKIDYKKEFLTVLDEIELQLPVNKNASYDLNTMRNILIESDTPMDALDKIKSELNLLPMPVRDENAPVPNQRAIFQVLDMMLAISQDNKEVFIYPQLNK